MKDGFYAFLAAAIFAALLALIGWTFLTTPAPWPEEEESPLLFGEPMTVEDALARVPGTRKPGEE